MTAFHWKQEDNAEHADARVVAEASVQDAATRRYMNTAALYATLIRSGVLSGGDSTFYLSILQPKLELSHPGSRRPLSEAQKAARVDLINERLSMIAHYYGETTMKRGRGVFEWAVKAPEHFEKTLDAVRKLVVFADSLQGLQEHAMEIRSTLNALGVEVEEGEEFAQVRQHEYNIVDRLSQEDEAVRTRAQEASAKTRESLTGSLRAKLGGGLIKGLQSLLGFDMEAETSAEVSLEAEQSARWARESRRSASSAHDLERKSNTSTETRRAVDSTLMTYGMTQMLAVAAILEVRPADFGGHRKMFQQVNAQDPKIRGEAIDHLKANRDALTSTAEKLTELGGYLKNSPDIGNFLSKYLTPSDVQAFKKILNEEGDYLYAYEFLKMRRGCFKTVDDHGRILSPVAGMEQLESIKSTLLMAGVIDDFVMEWRQAERYASEMSGVLTLEEQGRIQEKPCISSFMTKEELDPYLGWSLEVCKHYVDENDNGFYGVNLTSPSGNCNLMGVCSEIPGLKIGESYVLEFDKGRDRLRWVDDRELQSRKDFDARFFADMQQSISQSKKNKEPIALWNAAPSPLRSDGPLQ